MSANKSLQVLDDHGSRASTAVADAGQAVLATLDPQGGDQTEDEPGPAGADGVA